MPIKINTFQAENVKRIKAVVVEPQQSGLTIVGGKNGQGKTSVLDSIAWALGGDKYKPSEPRRDGSTLPPALRIEMSNGLVVERKGKNSDLHVIDPAGNKAGQQLLNSFVEQLALDLPKFAAMPTKEKAKTLLNIIGVGDRLFTLEDQEQRLFVQRTEIGRIRDQKQGAADEMDVYPDAPDEIVSASELIRQQQELLAKNGENQRLRERAQSLDDEALILSKQIAELTDKYERVLADRETAKKTAAELRDESTEELERNISDIDEINRKVRVNIERHMVADEAQRYADQYADLTGQIEDIRKEKLALLEGAVLPLEGLSIEGGELTYKGYKWDNLSGSDQLKVSTAIVRKLNPDCGFVLLDKLEQMDLDTLKEFGAWLEKEGLQAIATRVSTGDECQIIIEDGYSAAADGREEQPPTNPKAEQLFSWGS